MADDYDVLGSFCPLNSADIRKQVAQTLASSDLVLDGRTSEDKELTDFLDSASKTATSPLKELSVTKQQNLPPKKVVAKRQTKAKEKQSKSSGAAAEAETATAAAVTCAEPVTRRRTRSSVTRANAAPASAPAPTPPPPTPPPVPKRKTRQRRSQTQNVSLAAIAALQSAAAARMVSMGPAEALNAMRRAANCSQRNYVAQLAAYCPTVDYVDLVSSPVPRIEGVVTVDSDTEDSKSNDVEITAVIENSANTLDCSFDEENPEMSIKIKWNSVVEVFRLRKYQKFAHIFQQLAEREKTTVEHLVFNIDSRIISPSDTPHSIDYKIYEFICGRVLDGKLNMAPKKRDANKITLKIQSDLWPKHPLKVELFKTDTFKILYIKCAEELNTPYERLKLSFDGEQLDMNATPIEFEFEGGEAIDLRINSITK